MRSEAVFGGGCFWCTEAVFRRLRGVTEVVPGYAGGTRPNPTYEQVCAGVTGHAEVVKVAFNPAEVSYDDLLTVFFASHDPTTPDQQGRDVGPQYRSVVFFTDEQQRLSAEAFIARLNSSTDEGGPIVTELKPLERFWPAEDYHRRYYEQNQTAPYCQIVINPKLVKLQEKFASLLKDSNVAP